MPAKNEEEAREVGRLFTTAKDYLAALPKPEVLGDTRWREKPANLETWLYDKRYMGLTIRLSEKQLEALRAMDDIDPRTNTKDEFVLEWGKGSGKDFISALAGLRQVYQLLCLRDPYDYFGMAKNTGIQVVNVAYVKEQAKFVYLKQVKGLLNGSLWFKKQSPVITRERIKFRDEIEFVSTSADGDAAEGQNILFAVMDEASAFKTAALVKAGNRADGVKADRDADSIYKVLRTSSRSRFPGVGKVVIISYPRYRDDFTQQKRKENEKSERGWVSGPYATWEVNPRVKREDFAEDYRRNPETAKAMYECDPPFSEDGYIKYPKAFVQCVARTGVTMPELRYPIDSNDAFEPWFEAKPGAWYSIHVDLALKKDRAFMCVARQGEPVVTRACKCGAFNLKDSPVCVQCGIPYENWLERVSPSMVVTLLRRFKPRLGDGGIKEVDFSQVREEIMWLRERGHKIWSLTYDGWQSIDSIQTMRQVLGKRVLKDRWGQVIGEQDIVNTHSVDRDTKSYDTLKEFVYNERFYLYPPDGDIEDEDNDDPVALAYREFRALRLLNAKKVDHPVGGSKDATDAIAGAAFFVAQMPMMRSRVPRVAGWREKSDSKQ